MKATPEDVAKIKRPADPLVAAPASMKATPEDVAKIARLWINLVDVPRPQ